MGRPLQVVGTPTGEFLAERARACGSRMLFASPYVNRGVLELTGLVPRDARRVLVTRTDLRDFAVGSSDLEVLCALAREGVEVQSLSGLHAKMYIFDDAYALVTSANATTSGMRRNLECGIGSDDRGTVRRLSTFLETGLGGDEPPSKMRLADLERLHGPVEAIRVDLPGRPSGEPDDGEQPSREPTYSIADADTLLNGFTGWKRLTLEAVMEMPEGGFRLEQLRRRCAPVAARRYPRNRNVQAKLRQQLQFMRELGFVDFVRPGHFRRTMNVG